MRESPAHQILVVVDKPNWAHDYKTRNLQHILGGEYNLIKRYQAEVCESDLDEADLIQVYYWLQFEKMIELETAFKRNIHKLLLGVCSHIELENERRQKGLTWLSQARAIFAVNYLLYKEISAQLDVPVFYTPNGVDTVFFQPSYPRPRGEALRIGWAGSLTNQGLEQRGFHLISQAVESIQGCELATAIREEYWRSHEEMVDFYHSIDVYICASRNDGTPNPCLEAASCGIPIVTTQVGNMPELIQPGVNGYFIERDVTDIMRVLTLLRDDEPHRKQLGKAIRASILSWDWSLQANNYRQMYHSVLIETDTRPKKSQNKWFGWFNTNFMKK